MEAGGNTGDTDDPHQSDDTDYARDAHRSRRDNGAYGNAHRARRTHRRNNGSHRRDHNAY